MLGLLSRRKKIYLERVADLKRNWQWIYTQMLIGVFVRNFPRIVQKSELPVQRSILPYFAFYPLLNLLLKLKSKQVHK